MPLTISGNRFAVQEIGITIESLIGASLFRFHPEEFPPMAKWEYKIIDSRDVPGNGLFKGRDRGELEEYLRKLGEDGWEIVNVDFNELEGGLEFLGVAKRRSIPLT